jgi:hypothetical protein
MRNRRRKQKQRITEQKKKTQRRRRKADYCPSRSPVSNCQQHPLKATAGPPLFLLRLPPSLHLLRFHPPLFYVNSGEVLYCLLGWAALAQPKMVGPSSAQFNFFFQNSKNLFKKFVIFPCILSSNFAQYWIVFLYRKYTNSILKYPVSSKH